MPVFPLHFTGSFFFQSMLQAFNSYLPHPTARLNYFCFNFPNKNCRAGGYPLIPRLDIDPVQADAVRDIQRYFSRANPIPAASRSLLQRFLLLYFQLAVYHRQLYCLLQLEILLQVFHSQPLQYSYRKACMRQLRYGLLFNLEIPPSFF